jgi:hypothetical protein
MIFTAKVEIRGATYALLPDTASHTSCTHAISGLASPPGAEVDGCWHADGSGVEGFWFTLGSSVGPIRVINGLEPRGSD